VEKMEWDVHFGRSIRLRYEVEYSARTHLTKFHGDICVCMLITWAGVLEHNN
jgi:hypothetical protein